MTNFIHGFVQLGISGLISAIIVAVLTYYLNHRPHSHDTRRVEVEEKRAGLEAVGTEEEKARDNADLLETIARVSQDQAKADRERASTALAQAQMMEGEMTKLRDEVDALRDTVRKQEKTIEQLREEIAQVINQNRLYQRANADLERENTYLRTRFGHGEVYNSEEPKLKPPRSGA